ncbi:MAG: class I tRNA ligase family protein [Firmicutes bacterium]|nr:class I tRNA ligase family protein [Bacillota bacterium]
MTNKFYITTPIYYPSGDWHIGHCYTTVNCDALARFYRLKGRDVFFLTGTDEHGLKIETVAKAEGVTPKDLVDKRAKGLSELFTRLNISNDIFWRTTDKAHKRQVEYIFTKLFDRGEIYKDKYEGLYCVPCESYWTERQAENKVCPDCKRELSEKSEEAYFFRLSKYKERLLDLYKARPEFLQPMTRQKEMVGNYLKAETEDLRDLCVSRAGLEWGIRVPFDKEQTIYVWIDALFNYMTALGYFECEAGAGDNSVGVQRDNSASDNAASATASKDFTNLKRFWSGEVVHMVAKEIVRFHAIIWPAMLMALDLPLPKRVFGHGWLLMGDDKMSKSKGNVACPDYLIGQYGVDAVRHFLLAEYTFGSDGAYTEERLIKRINTDLANNLGNLVSRTFAMAKQYFGGKVEKLEKEKAADKAFIKEINGLLGAVETRLSAMEIDKAVSEITQLGDKAAKYIDDNKPWVLAKDQKTKGRLSVVLYNVLECIRVVGVLLQAFLPQTADKIFARFDNLPDNLKTFGSAKYGLLPVGIATLEGDTLFARIK